MPTSSLKISSEGTSLISGRANFFSQDLFRGNISRLWSCQLLLSRSLQREHHSSLVVPTSSLKISSEGTSLISGRANFFSQDLFRGNILRLWSCQLLLSRSLQREHPASLVVPTSSLKISSEGTSCVSGRANFFSQDLFRGNILRLWSCQLLLSRSLQREHLSSLVVPTSSLKISSEGTSLISGRANFFSQDLFRGNITRLWSCQLLLSRSLQREHLSSLVMPTSSLKISSEGTSLISGRANFFSQDLFRGNISHLWSCQLLLSRSLQREHHYLWSCQLLLSRSLQREHHSSLVVPTSSHFYYSFVSRPLHVHQLAQAGTDDTHNNRSISFCQDHCLSIDQL